MEQFFGIAFTLMFIFFIVYIIIKATKKNDTISNEEYPGQHLLKTIVILLLVLIIIGVLLLFGFTIELNQYYANSIKLHY